MTCTAALAAAAALSLAGCEKQETKAPAAAAAAMPVQTVTVAARDLPATLEFVARTESSRAVSINSRIAGFLMAKPYTEGTYVRQGDVLFELDKKPLEAQVAQIEAQLASSQAAHATALTSLKRIRPLAAAKAVSQSELDTAVGQEKTTGAAVAQTQALLQEARLNLSYATIRSPINGLAGSVEQAEGTYISAANSVLTTVYALSPMWVVFSMSENQVLELSRGFASGRMRLPADSNLTVRVEMADGTFARDTGQLSFIAPAFDSKTGTFKLRASLPNKPVGEEGGMGQLRPNQFVRVHLEGIVRPSAVAVPQRAVQQGAHGNFVWVVRDGKAQMQPVKVGEWIGAEWYIPQGLKAGDVVITDGLLRLAPGVAVKAAAQPAAKSPAAK